MREDHLIEWLIGYAIVVGIVLIDSMRRKSPSVGMPAAYTFNLLMNHYFGALIYALPWYQTNDYNYVYLGFQQTFYGMMAFAAGSLVLGPLYIRHFTRPLSRQSVKPNPKLPFWYLVTGLIFYAVLGPFLRQIPTVGTFVQSGWYLLITAVCLYCWKAWQEKRSFKMFVWAGLSLIFPFFTTFNSGFLGFGVVALMSIMFFIASFYKPRWIIVIGVFAGMYLGLSLCETYFRDRNELREVIWHEQGPVVERIDRTLWTLSRFEFLDLGNQDHLYRIDMRLNQNTFVGKAITYIGDGQQSFARGGTLWDSVLTLIPRIFWPDKPILWGGSEMMSKYTGQKFSEGTTFGVGQVMEFYINFGTAGVIIGFLILGVIICYFDHRAAHDLGRGHWQGFVLWFLPGIGFMQSLNTLVQVVMTVSAAIIFCLFINKILMINFSGKRNRKLTA